MPESDTPHSLACQARTSLDQALDAISPRRGPKYSPNLHAYLSARKGGLTPRMARLFEDREGTLWLGFPDDTGAFIGQRLSLVLCLGARAQTFSYEDLGPLAERTTFWGEYLRDGRCAVDRTHRVAFVGSDTRFETRGDIRSCLWCGKAKQAFRRYSGNPSGGVWNLVGEPANGGISPWQKNTRRIHAVV